MSDRLDSWMDGYLEAWTSNDPALVAALFTPDAVYDPQTAVGELHGVGEIVDFWLEADDREDNWDFSWIPLVETDEVAVITGTTVYYDPAASYRNLFVIRFAPDGRCHDFTEWYIEEEA